MGMMVGLVAAAGAAGMATAAKNPRAAVAVAKGGKK